MNEKRSFYRRVIAVALPLIIQNGITNFVSLLDNVMVGQVGTIPMSGVAIVNQLLFVFNLCVFGAVSGAGIFTAQFHGAQDTDGIRHTFRFKILAALGLTLTGIALFLAAGPELIGLYLTGEGSATDAAATLDYGHRYLLVMLVGLPPFAIANAYSSTLRETDQGTVPMAAGVAAVLVNLCLNYVLIFGHFGAPALGVIGAAVATVISRYVELTIVAVWTHCKPGRNPFIQGAYRSCRIPVTLAKNIAIKGMPLLVNEALWSMGMAFQNQCYSTRGLDVVAATNISSTIYNLASVVYLSLGNAVGILMGQMLGANLPEADIRRDNKRLIRLSVLICLVFGGLMIACSGLFPRLYNTTEQVRSIAAGLIIISALMMPANSYNNAVYFTLRSGGQTFVTFLFDSVFVWTVVVPLAYCLSRFTSLPIFALYAICVGTDFLKIVVGAFMLKKGTWIRRIVV